MNVMGEPQPGIAPGSGGPSGPMFAALYGEFTPHERAEDVTADPYSLFHERSVGMGWIAEGDGGGLWGMNDAGLDHPGARPDDGLIAWFQVGVEGLATGRPLPVQPFLRCAGDAMARLGSVRLRSVQVLLPVDVLAASAGRSALPPSLSAAGWFHGIDPGERVQVRITVDSGQDPSVPAAAPALLGWMNRFADRALRCDACSVTAAPLDPGPVFDDGFWGGPPANRATLSGVLAEWSLDAVGWAAAFLADACARNGVAAPVVFTATRVGG